MSMTSAVEVVTHEMSAAAIHILSSQVFLLFELFWSYTQDSYIKLSF
jgi:hypothetical protein